MPPSRALFFFFFNDTATTEIYTLSLHDALPILTGRSASSRERGPPWSATYRSKRAAANSASSRSEEHTSELQSQSNLVCRLLLEKKKKQHSPRTSYRHRGDDAKQARQPQYLQHS